MQRIKKPSQLIFKQASLKSSKAVAKVPRKTWFAVVVFVFILSSCIFYQYGPTDFISNINLNKYYLGVNGTETANHSSVTERYFDVNGTKTTDHINVTKHNDGVSGTKKNNIPSTSVAQQNSIPLTSYDFGHLLNMKNQITPAPVETITTDELLKDYMDKVKAMQAAGFWTSKPKLNNCSNEPRQFMPCIHDNCQNKAIGVRENLEEIFQPVRNLDTVTVSLVLGLLQARPTGKRVLFLTGASSNHFLEVQDMIKSMHEFVFPTVKNFSFVFYDLGLSQEQRKQVEKHCRCEVRTFPLSQMPPRVKNLNCFTWKTFIMQANVPTADIVIWNDSSVRYLKNMTNALLQEVETKGLVLTQTDYAIGDHTQQSMMDYFGESSCRFSQVSEKQGGFQAAKNERFIRQAVYAPLGACAMSPKCMCTSPPGQLFCNTKKRKLNKCHRFDQSAISVLTAKLFWGYEKNFVMSKEFIKVDRSGKYENYFHQIEHATH